jgi:hypothetical protein
VAALVLASGCGYAPATLAERALRELRSGDYDKAIATCDEAIKLDPLDAAAYHSRGLAHHYRDRPGDMEKAIADFTDAINLRPKRPDAYYSRSLAYRDNGDLELAAADDTQARELDMALKEVHAQMAEAALPSGAGPREKPEDGSEETGAKPLDAQNLADDYEKYLELRNRYKKPDEPNPETLSPGLEASPFAAPVAAPPVSSIDQFRSLLSKPRIPPSRTADETLSDDNETPTTAAPRSGTSGLAQPTKRGAGKSSTGPRSSSGPTPLRSRQGGQFVPDTAYDSSYDRPYPTPFPQRQPSPTGVVEPPQGIFPQPGLRQPGFQPPSTPNVRVHPPGAYQNDLYP